MALFVAVEGLPGCGKTTVIGLLIQALRAMGLRARDVDIDTAPSTPELRAYANAYPLTNSLHMMAMWMLRIQQHEVIQAIRPDMDVILSDRSWWSAIAFDCYGNGVDQEFPDWIWIGQEEKVALPDIVLFLRAPLHLLRKRKESRTMQNLVFARRVARGYQVLARMHEWQVIDATRTPEQVKGDCLGIIRTALAEK